MPSQLHLKTNPTLADYQKYIAEMIVERGFEEETIPELFMMLQEECGELAKACRKFTNIKNDVAKPIHENIGHELADVLVYLLDIANHFDIDLEAAFREKEEINKGRIWQKLSPHAHL